MIVRMLCPDFSFLLLFFNTSNHQTHYLTVLHTDSFRKAVVLRYRATKSSRDPLQHRKLSGRPRNLLHQCLRGSSFSVQCIFSRIVVYISYTILTLCTRDVDSFSLLRHFFLYLQNGILQQGLYPVQIVLCSPSNLSCNKVRIKWRCVLFAQPCSLFAWASLQFKKDWISR